MSASRSRGLVAGLVVSCVALLPGSGASAAGGRHDASSDVTAQGGTALVDQAKILYDDLQYDKALAKLRAALTHKDLAKRDLVEIYQYMGFIYLIQKKPRLAEASFELLLRHEPDYQLNPLLTPPKFIAFFQKVKARTQAQKAVIIRHTPPSSFRAGEPMTITAYVVDRGKTMARVDVYYRMKGASTSFSSVDLQPDPEDATKFTGQIPYVFGERNGSFEVEYYVAALASDGRWLATAGDPKHPYSFAVHVTGTFVPKGKPGLLSKWWFWTGLVVIAGAAGGGVYLATRPGPPAPTHGGAIVVIR